MKTSLRLALLGCALSIAASTVAAAQSQSAAPTDDSSSMQAPHKAPDPQHQTARLSRLLQLTPEQAAKIEPILQNRDQQIQQLRSEGSGGGGHGKMRAIMEDTNTQVQAILTDSQKQKYQQMMQQAMERRQAKKNGSASGTSPGDDGE